MQDFTFGPEDLIVGSRRLHRVLDVGSDHRELGHTVLRLRALESFDLHAARYAIQRTVRASVRRPVDELFDDLAVGAELNVQRLGSASLLLDGPGVFVSASGQRKTDYSSVTFEIWADGLARLELVRDRLLQIVGEQLERREMFTIDWHFHSTNMGLTSAAFDEMADAPPLDEAYPTLAEPVSAFIRRYLDSRETVLILQGQPGTGKTRLVRAILAAMSVRKQDSAKVLYTSDRRALENDELFVEFITGTHDAFVIEDADHLLMARANGNVDLHRFLSVADGVVRAQGRKIIFTTNLPNVGDIDDALLRPGRCFATVRTRALARHEALALVRRLGFDAALPADPGSLTLAALYRQLEIASDPGAGICR